MKLDTHQLAWAAGFFDGEGCTSISGNKIHVVINGTEVAPMMRFHAAVGWLGYINGPYPQKGIGRKPVFVYTVSRFEHVQAVIAMLWRFMSRPKREQATRALMFRREYQVARALSSASTPTPKG